MSNKPNYDSLTKIFANWEAIKAAHETSNDSKYDIPLIVKVDMRRFAGTFDEVKDLKRISGNQAVGELRLKYKEGEKERIASININQIKEISQPSDELLRSAREISKQTTEHTKSSQILRG
jgi:hypothetical protein